MAARDEVGVGVMVPVAMAMTGLVIMPMSRPVLRMAVMMRPAHAAKVYSMLLRCQALHKYRSGFGFVPF